MTQQRHHYSADLFCLLLPLLCAARLSRPVIPLKHNTRGRLNTTEMRKSLGSMGIDTAAAEARIRERSQSRGRKRIRWARGTFGSCCLCACGNTIG